MLMGRKGAHILTNLTLPITDCGRTKPPHHYTNPTKMTNLFQHSNNKISSILAHVELIIVAHKMTLFVVLVFFLN